MLNLIKRLLNKRLIAHTAPVELPDPEQLDYKQLPVLSGEQLIAFLNQTNKIRTIKRWVMIDGERFEKMYLEPIHKMCELVQLAPASQAYHHSFGGGLIIHTLSVIERAITERQKHTLPLSSDPEIIEAQYHVWTYAVFIAALCHDLGKIVTMIAYIDSKDQRIKNIMEGTLQEQSVTRYHIGFKPTDHFSLHQSLGSCFLPLLFDKKSLGFISEELDIFAEVLAYIKGDEYDWGSVGSIVQTADRLSTAEALKIGTDSRKFPGANLENFGERIMRTLRVALNNTALPKNRAGATLWTNKHYTYAVAKPFAELIRDEMQKHGATDVPADNTRIFDELQQQGFCEINEEGQAIFKIEVILSDSHFQQTFTCIKIQNKRLFHANNLPKPLVGRIVEVVHDATASTSSTTETVSTAKPKRKPLQQNVTSTTETEIQQATSETVVKPTAETPSHHQQFDLPQERSAGTVQYRQTTETESTTLTTDAVIDEMMDEVTWEPMVKTATVQQQPTAAADSVGIPGDSELVEGFFDWIDTQVTSKEYIINRDSPLFVLEHDGKKHLCMMSPITFAVYAKAKGYASDITVGEPMKKAADIVQKAFHHQKINVGVAGQQVHLYKKTNSPSAKTPKLSFYLIPIKHISNRNLRENVEKLDYAKSMQRYYTEPKPK